MYQVSYKTTSKIGGSKNECLLEWDEEISIYGRDFPTLQRRIKKNVLQIWKIFSRFDIIIYTVEERAMFELYIHFVFVMSCVMCWFGCVVLLVCGLDIGQERSTWWNQIADPTYWFRRNEEIRAVRDPPDSRVVTLTMPTLTDPIVKMVLEIGCWIPLDLQETWYIWSQAAWKTSGSAKKQLILRSANTTRFESVGRRSEPNLFVVCLLLFCFLAGWFTSCRYLALSIIM